MIYKLFTILLFTISSDENKQQSGKRKFRPEWLHSFKWLRENDGCAFCICCAKPLISHCSHLKAHEKTTHHIQNYEAKKTQHTMENFYNSDQQKQSNQVRNAELTLVMFCITHNLPLLLMDFLPGLLVECCPDSSIAKLVKCGRTKSVQLVEYIAKQASQNVMSDLRTKKFSLIVDETTDISTKSCIVFLARYFDKAHGVHDKFIALLELTKSDAISIFNLIKDFFSSNNIPLKNLIGLATDGANVMAGNINGLQALLKSETDLFYIKCSCHSLHLCTSYACKKLPDYIEKLCRNIYEFFSRSPKRVNEFKEFQEYCSVEPHKILGICKTRWLSLEGVVLRIIEQWDCLKLFFISCAYEVNDIKPKKLAEGMTSKMKSYFLFLSYILPIVNNLNKEFQTESSRLPYLYSSLKSNFLLILSNFIRTDLINNNTDIDFKNEKNHLELSTIFIGTKAEIYITKNLDKNEILELKKYILNFYIELLNQINARFDFKRDDIKLLQNITPMEVVSTKDLPILPLILNFPNLVDCDPDLITTQWSLLRLTETNLSVELDIDTFWKKVESIKNGLNENSFRELANFVFNLLSLPHSSAAAERSFSTLSYIKTKLRNKLEISTINNMMLCKALVKKADPHYVWSTKKDFINKIN